MRALRLKLSREQNVPSYVIFHNDTLVEMARKQPGNAVVMNTVSGVGQVKMQRYGADFLDAIKRFKDELGDISVKVFPLLLQHWTIL